MIEFFCPQCGRQFTVADEFAGKRARCRACASEVRVPSGAVGTTPHRSGAAPVPARTPDEALGLETVCGTCGKVYRVPASLAGKVVRCKDCGQPVRIQAEGAESGSPREAATSNSDGDVIRFECEDCGREFVVPSSMAGKTVKCKGCSRNLRIPGALADGVLDDVYGLENAAPAPLAPAVSSNRREDPEPAPHRGWMSGRGGGPQHTAADRAEYANAIRTGLGMIGFGLVATILPQFGLVLKSRGGQALGEKETVYAGIALAALGGVIAAFGYLKSRMPARPKKERQGPSWIIIGGVLLIGSIVLFGILAALGRR